AEQLAGVELVREDPARGSRPGLSDDMDWNSATARRPLPAAIAVLPPRQADLNAPCRLLGILVLSPGSGKGSGKVGYRKLKGMPCTAGAGRATQRRLGANRAIQELRGSNSFAHWVFRRERS